MGKGEKLTEQRQADIEVDEIACIGPPILLGPFRVVLNHQTEERQ